MTAGCVSKSWAAAAAGEVDLFGGVTGECLVTFRIPHPQMLSSAADGGVDFLALGDGVVRLAVRAGDVFSE